VNEFLSFAIGGLPFACSYALVAVGIVLTFRATGVFNFGFGAMAYGAGVTYVELCSHGVPAWLSLLIVTVVLAPVFGALLDWGLFRRIRTADLTSKVVTSLGLMVFLPSVVQIVIGPTTVYSAPAPFLSTYFTTLFGISISGPVIATLVTTIVVLMVMTLGLRSRRVGLTLRASVQSPRLVELHGVDSGKVLRNAWMVSSSLAALAGCLYAPQFATQSPGAYNVLLTGAVAAAALGAISSFTLAVAGGVLLGVLQGVIPGYLSPNSVWYGALVPSIPFFMLLIMLLTHRGFRSLDRSKDPMAVVEPPTAPPGLARRSEILGFSGRIVNWLAVVGLVIVAIIFVPEVWVGTLTIAASMAIIFLSVTLLTGLAGQLSLAQMVFAGMGAYGTARLSTHHHWSLGMSLIAGTMIASLGGLVASLPALRLRGLPLALLTLCFALLADNLIFPATFVGNGSSSIGVRRPDIFGVDFSGPFSRNYLVMVVTFLAMTTFGVRLLIHGTTGRMLTAAHSSEIAAASSGVPMRRTITIIFMLSAAVAGLGGGLYAIALGSLSTPDFNSAFGPVLLVVVITMGAASVRGALIAGVAFVALPQALALAPSRFGGGGQSTAITIVLLSVGAFTYAQHPEGIVTFIQGRLKVAGLKIRDLRGDPR